MKETPDAGIPGLQEPTGSRWETQRKTLGIRWKFWRDLGKESSQKPDRFPEEILAGYRRDSGGRLCRKPVKCPLGSRWEYRVVLWVSYR